MSLVQLCSWDSDVFLVRRSYKSPDTKPILKLSSSRAADHTGQQLVASMICLKPCAPPCSTSNEPVPGLLRMCVSMFSLDDLFYVFIRLVSISLRSWNADDWEDVGCG